ncbi:MAG: nucleoside-diphosphate kinase [Chlamydiales bacterium]
MERTLVLLKPDAVQRGLIGNILSRFENKGLKLVGLKMRIFPKDHLQKHYDVHRERPFFNSLVDFMSSSPVVAIALEGNNAIAVARQLIGPTNSAEAPAGTIRGDLGMSFSHNLVHGSDAPETAASELALWFGDAGELSDWTPCGENWVYDAEEELA